MALGFIPLLVGIVSLLNIVIAQNTTQNATGPTIPNQNFIGCYSKTACGFSKAARNETFDVGNKMIGPGTGQQCIDFCNLYAPQKGKYSFAGMEASMSYYICYCFEQLIAGHKLMANSACTNCTDDCPRYFMVWGACPVGFYDYHSGCTAVCPSYCVAVTNGTRRCTVTGSCVDGCINNFCGIDQEVMVVGPTPSLLTQAHPPYLVLYLGYQITKAGYLAKINFYGRTKGVAYVSIWTPNGISVDPNYPNNEVYIMKGKVKIQNAFEGVRSLILNPSEYINVDPNDILGIHYDAAFFADSSIVNATDYTIFYTSPSGGDARLSNLTYGRDDGWKIGQTVYIDPANKLSLSVSVQLSIHQTCPKTCSGRRCTTTGGIFTCTNGCVVGYSGADCSQSCPATKFGANCAQSCSSSCLNSLCDPVMGSCISCPAGTKGANCSQPCSRGTWGVDCSNACASCYKGMTCDITTGACSWGCNKGYKLPDCATPCDVGKFGVNCSYSCSQFCDSGQCDVRDGYCAPLTGFLQGGVYYCTASSSKSGKSCFCDSGKWGADCSKKCGTCFATRTLNPIDCEAPTGMCTGDCDKGYAKPTCHCQEGKWGPNCEYACGNCYNAGACDTLDGFCFDGCTPGYQAPQCTEKCRPGSWGSFCQNICGMCKNVDVCDPTTGSCPNGCANSGLMTPLCAACSAGFYGSNCTYKCGSCATGSCNYNTGECSACSDIGLTMPQCLCPIGKWGPNCNINCSNCQTGCRADTGLCIGSCTAGWTGSAGACNQKCQPGNWGSGCAFVCGSCVNNEICDKVTGNCPTTCQAGYRFPQCKCLQTQYGQNCEKQCGFCLNSAICDVVTGACASGCMAGYKAPTCNEVCDPGQYGPACSKQCGSCLASDCNKQTGLCANGCTAGKVPPMCVDTCPAGRWGESCKFACGACKGTVNANCDPATGACPGGCIDFYQPPSCMTQCLSTYGATCTNKCPACKGNIQCNSKTGECLFGCGPGFLPPSCSKPCADGQYGIDCKGTCGNCLGGACSHTDGTCTNGCDGAFEMPLCKQPCFKGHWGKSCANVCGRCKDCATCDPTAGTCSGGCDPGFTGNDCGTQCKPGFYGDGCKLPCGTCRGDSSGQHQPCNAQTGICDVGCDVGYLPPLCKVRMT